MPKKKTEEMVYDAETGEVVSRKDNMQRAFADAQQKRGYRARGNADDSVMISLRIPKTLKESVQEAAKRHGRSQSEQIIISVEDGLAMQNAIKAVSDCLQKNPPPFVSDDWKPSVGECTTFILQAIDDAIKLHEQN